MYVRPLHRLERGTDLWLLRSSPLTVPRSLVVTLLVALVAAGPVSAAGVRVGARDERLSTTRVLSESERVLPARLAPFAFNLVGLHWRGSGEVSFRTAALTGRWSSWRPARPEPEDGPDPASAEARGRAGWTIGNPYWTGRAERIQYRLAGRVTRLRAHFVASPLGVSPRRPATAAPGAPVIISRAAWGADESIVREAPSYADRLTFSIVHHTAGTRPSSPAQSAAIVRGVQAYHVRSNGWNDIGYNFLVDPFGQVFEGRAGGTTRNVVGAHAQGFNTGSAGVALLGTYEGSSISPEARETLVDLLAWRLDLAHVDPLARVNVISGGSPKFAAGTAVTLNAVSGHRDVGATSCPGSALYGELGRVASEAAARGLPKLYDPRVAGSVGGPVRFTARLSSALDWTATVFDGAGSIAASGRGFGTLVDWTWQAAGVPPGRYTYAIDAGPDVRPARGPVGAGVPLEISRVSAGPDVVTPNGDGVGDSLAMSVNVTTAASLTVWLQDSAGSRVAILANRAVGAGTTRFTWRGRDAAGRIVADGRYRLVVEVSAGAERASATARTIVVDRTVGHLTSRPAAFSPNGDGRRDTLTVGFSLARQADVRVHVLAGARTVATLLARRIAGEGRQTVSWSGAGADGRRIRDGRLRAVLEATTTLGTRRLTADFVLDTRAPHISGISARRSERGTLVRLRLSEPDRMTVRFGRSALIVERRAGVVSLWRRTRPSAVSVVAEDAAANRSARASARVRRSAQRS